MSETLKGDPFNLPPHPRFLHEAVLVPFEDGFLVDGAPNLQILRGKALREIVTLLDGTHSIADVEASFPDLTSADIRSAVATLFRYGLLEDQYSNLLRRNQSDEDPGITTLSFFRRFLNATKWNQCATEAYERLRAYRVIILAAPHECGSLLADLLVKTGLAKVEVRSQDRTTSLLRGVDTPTLVVALSRSSENTNYLSWLHDDCSANQSGWLRAVFADDLSLAEIGPHFRAQRACYECFRAVHSWPALKKPVQTVTRGWEWWVSQVAVEIIYSISRIGRVLTHKGLRRFDLNDLTHRDLLVTRVPGCTRCHGERVDDPASKNAGSLPQPVVFENSIEVSSRATIDPILDVEQKLRGEYLVHQFKSFSFSPQIRPNPNQVPEERLNGRPGPDAEICDGTALTLSQLGRLLRIAAGVRTGDLDGKGVKRFCASGGNLGSPELYVIALNVLGVTPGLYFYETNDVLAHLRWRNDKMSPIVLSRNLIGSNRSPNAYVVFTGAFHKLRRKYGAFGYKLTHLDAGVAIAQMQILASSTGIDASIVPAFNEVTLEGALNLRSSEEIVTGVMTLSTSTTWSFDSCFTEPQAAKADLPVREYEYDNLNADTIISKLQLESQQSRPKIRFHSNEKASAETHLVPEVKNEVPASSAFAKRRSVRHFADVAIGIRDLATILSYALNADRHCWTGLQEQFPLTLYIVANKVNYLLCGGIYKFRDEIEEFELISRISEPCRIELFLQPEIASAAATIWIVADLTKSSTFYPSWGYRSLLVRAGGIANRLWMMALDRNLSGVIIGGFGSDAAYTAIQINGCDRAALTVFAIGIEAAEGDKATSKSHQFA